MFNGLLAQQLAANYGLMGRINAVIYAKRSGLTAEDLGGSQLLCIQQEAPAKEAPPSAPAAGGGGAAPSPKPTPSPSPSPAPAPATKTGLVKKTWQLQADRTYKLVSTVPYNIGDPI
jgi:hypothetical protein